MNIEIPRGFVYGSLTKNLRKTHFHIVLKTDEKGFYKDILYIGRRGLNMGKLVVYRSEIHVDSEKFREFLRRKKIFLLTEYQFDHFRDFYKVSNFINSNLYEFYSSSSDLIRSTAQLEQLVNQNQ